MFGAYITRAYTARGPGPGRSPLTSSQVLQLGSPDPVATRYKPEANCFISFAIISETYMGSIYLTIMQIMPWRISILTINSRARSYLNFSANFSDARKQFFTILTILAVNLEIMMGLLLLESIYFIIKKQFYKTKATTPNSVNSNSTWNRKTLISNWCTSGNFI